MTRSDNMPYTTRADYEVKDNQAILTKAIQKAIEGGWEQNLHYLHGNLKDKEAIFMKWVSNLELAGDHAYYNYDEYFCVLELIFNHDFAKALWGECTTWFNNQYGPGIVPKDGYQFHLQQMVIADDPIAYLGENI
jgi:hypothetical protein